MFLIFLNANHSHYLVAKFLFMILFVGFLIHNYMLLKNNPKLFHLYDKYIKKGSLRKMAERLDALIKKEKLFLQSNLNLAEVARMLGMSSKGSFDGG